MRADLERSQTGNKLAYEELVTVIEASQGTLALLIAVCDDLKLRDSIIQQYEQDLKPEFHAYQLQLAKDEPSLRAVLGKWAEQQNRSASSTVLTVTGAENLLWFKLQEDDFERTEVDKFFGYLQWGREGLREFPYPIVLWVTQRILMNLSLKAPDFWSWRKGVFRFVSDVVTDLPLPFPGYEHFLPPSLPDVDSFLLPLEDLQELITATEQREGTEAPLLGTLYSRLAQVYQYRIEQGEAKNFQEEKDLVIANYKKAISIQTSLHQDLALLSILICLGNFYFSQGNFQAMIPTFQQSLQISQNIENHNGQADSLGNLGNAYNSLGQYPRAIEYYKKSLAIQQEIGDRNGEANSLNNLGNSYDALGQHQRAIELFEQSLVFKRSINDRIGEANSLNNLGSSYNALGQYSLAIEFYGQSLVIQREILHRYGEAASLGSLGNAYNSLGQYPRAIEYYKKSLAIQREIGDRNGEAMSWFNLGIPFVMMNRVPDALEAYYQARQRFADIGLESRVQDCDNAVQQLSASDR
jgi:tetratricopeptide (TPR) repeat protein